MAKHCIRVVCSSRELILCTTNLRAVRDEKCKARVAGGVARQKLLKVDCSWVVGGAGGAGGGRGGRGGRGGEGDE
jgi:hypothetical protein